MSFLHINKFNYEYRILIATHSQGQILEASGRWDQVYFLNGSINVLAGIFFIAFYNSKKEYD